MNSSLRRAVVTSAISVVLWTAVLVVERVGRQPSSAAVKALVVVVVVLVLVALAAIPLGGGLLTLLAVRQDVRRRDRVAQALIAATIGLACVVAGLEWLAWLADPRGNPPGVGAPT